LAWNSWDLLCQPKEIGGLGFRQSKNFNQALLAKITWWIALGRDSLCMKALRSKYKVQADWLGKEPKKKSLPPLESCGKVERIG
jgi:hypothetical protein